MRLIARCGHDGITCLSKVSDKAFRSSSLKVEKIVSKQSVSRTRVQKRDKLELDMYDLDSTNGITWVPAWYSLESTTA